MATTPYNSGRRSQFPNLQVVLGLLHLYAPGSLGDCSPQPQIQQAGAGGGLLPPPMNSHGESSAASGQAIRVAPRVQRGGKGASPPDGRLRASARVVT